MPKTHAPYPPEYREQILELVRSGRSAEELAKEFEPTAQCLRNWIKQDELDRGQRQAQRGLTSEEKTELVRLRKENKQLKLEREILAKAAAWFARETELDPTQVFEFVSANQAVYPIRSVSRVLGVSPSGFYAWRKRPPRNESRQTTC